jgi:hypothetical protein
MVGCQPRLGERRLLLASGCAGGGEEVLLLLLRLIIQMIDSLGIQELPFGSFMNRVGRLK